MNDSLQLDLVSLYITKNTVHLLLSPQVQFYKYNEKVKLLLEILMSC